MKRQLAPPGRPRGAAAGPDCCARRSSVKALARSTAVSCPPAARQDLRLLVEGGLRHLNDLPGLSKHLLIGFSPSTAGVDLPLMDAAGVSPREAARSRVLLRGFNITTLLEWPRQPIAPLDESDRLLMP